MEFNPILALRLAGASLDAYGTPKPGLIVIDDPKRDTLCTIENAQDAIVCAFRGTIDNKNWLVDLDVEKTHNGLHKGFADAWQALRDRVCGAIYALNPAKTKPVLITGHSLGGALAIFAANSCGASSVYTFGQPRVGVKGVMRGFDHSKLWRVVNKTDGVPMVPGLLIGYRHFGNEMFFSESEKFIENPMPLTIFKNHARGICSDIARIFAGKLPEWVVAEDHSMKKYFELVANHPVVLDLLD